MKPTYVVLKKLNDEEKESRNTRKMTKVKKTLHRFSKSIWEKTGGSKKQKDESGGNKGTVLMMVMMVGGDGEEQDLGGNNKGAIMIMILMVLWLTMTKMTKVPIWPEPEAEDCCWLRPHRRAENQGGRCSSLQVRIDKPARLIIRLLFGFASDSIWQTQPIYKYRCSSLQVRIFANVKMIEWLVPAKNM